MGWGGRRPRGGAGERGRGGRSSRECEKSAHLSPWAQRTPVSRSRKCCTLEPGTATQQIRTCKIRAPQTLNPQHPPIFAVAKTLRNKPFARNHPLMGSAPPSVALAKPCTAAWHSGPWAPSNPVLRRKERRAPKPGPRAPKHCSRKNEAPYNLVPQQTFVSNAGNPLCPDAKKAMKQRKR